MADSKREKLLDNIVSALTAISTGSGYNFTIGEAKLGLKHFEETPSDKFPAAYVTGADEDSKNVTNSEFRSDVLAHVVGYVKVEDQQDAELLERYVSRFAEDIRKALMADPTRGGYSTYTEIVSVDTTKGAWRPYAGVEVVVRANYRSAFTAP